MAWRCFFCNRSRLDGFRCFAATTFDKIFHLWRLLFWSDVLFSSFFIVSSHSLISRWIILSKFNYWHKCFFSQFPLWRPVMESHNFWPIRFLREVHSSLFKVNAKKVKVSSSAWRFLVILPLMYSHCLPMDQIIPVNSSKTFMTPLKSKQSSNHPYINIVNHPYDLYLLRKKGAPIPPST